MKISNLSDVLTLLLIGHEQAHQSQWLSSQMERLIYSSRVEDFLLMSHRRHIVSHHHIVNNRHNTAPLLIRGSTPSFFLFLIKVSCFLCIAALRGNRT